MVEVREPHRLLWAALAALLGVMVGLTAVAVPVGAATAIPTVDPVSGPARDAPAAAVGPEVYLFRSEGAGTTVDRVGTDGTVGLGQSIGASATGLPAVTIGGHVYLFVRLPEGGTAAQVLRFDPATMAFSAAARLPFLPTAATASGESILLLGPCLVGTCEGNATARYTPGTGTFQPLGPHHGPVDGAAFAGLRLLVPELSLPEPATTVWEVEPAKGTTQRTPHTLPVPTHGAAAVASPCGIFAFGGRVDGSASPLVQLIDPDTGRSGVLSWRLPGPASRPTAAVAADVAYIFGVGADGTTVAAAPLDALCDVPLEAAPTMPDGDGDGVPDASDNCPAVANPQDDTDGDGVGDACDTGATSAAPGTGPAPEGGVLPLPHVAATCTPNAMDLDLDGLSDPCDPDMDGDMVPDKGVVGAFLDVCPRVPDPDQRDSDHDGAGDACDAPTLAGRTARVQGRALAPVEVPSLLLPQAALLLAAAGAAGAWLWRHRWLSVLVVGFTRLRGDELVEQPVRRQILQFVTAQPGIHHQELRRKLGIGRGNLDHHVQVLLRSGHIREHRGSGYRCYFPPGTGAQAMRSSGVLKSELAQRLYEQVNASPGCAVSELARRTDADYRAVAYHLERFEGAGVAHLRHDGTTMRAYPAEMASAK